MNIEKFPLCWPPDYPRCKYPSRSRFKVSFARARDELLSEVQRMGGKNVILSTNIPLKKDGTPYADFKIPADKGVAVYFTRKNVPVCFACDLWDKIEDNIQSIFKTIEALRGLERWGASDMLDRAFTGFAALPAPATANWWEVLDCPRGSGPEVIRKARNIKAMKHHPDSGVEPNSDLMAKINFAYDQAMAEVKG